MHHIKFDGFFEVCMLAFARSQPFHSIFYLPSMKNSLISEICSYHLPFTILAEKYQFFCKRHLGISSFSPERIDLFYYGLL